MEADKIPTVLIIDDEPANLGVLFEHFRHNGLKTLIAQSGHFALQILERFQPDIVLLDIMLPDTDGFELCKQIRERNKDPDIPVIFLSALSDTERKIRALELDAVDYITKPFEPQEIIARIKRHLLIRDLQWQLQEQNVLLEREISEHREAEEALRRSEERLALGLRGSNDALWDWDLVGNELYYSPRWWSMLGYAEKELEDDPDLWRRLMHAEDLDRADRVVTAALEDSETFEVESRLLHKDGHYVPIRTRGFIVRDDNGKPVRVSGTNTDLTERKRGQEALRESEARYRLLAQNATDVIWTVDMDMRLTYISPSVTRLLGFAVEEAMARSMQQVFTPAAFEQAMQLVAEEMAIESAGHGDPNRSRIVELELVRKDGDTVPVEGNFCFLRDPTGRVTGILAIVRDMTERKRGEAQRLEFERHVLQSQKAESLGRMAGGIAHHFNNLLAAVMGNLELAMDDLPADALAGDCLSEAMRASRRAADLSRLMLTYVGQGVLEKTLCDLSEEVLRTVPLIEATLPGKVLLEKSVGSCLPLVNVDADSLRQIFVNLASNAWESLSDAGGIVRITTGAEFVEEATMSKVVGTEAPLPGNFVFIEVSDEGCGMNAETMARMFDPFFSTKLMGRGLGLATVAGILRSHQGAMLVDSRPGMGTNVRILLPVAGEPRCSVTAEPDLVARGSQFSRSCSLGALTVLLAEDEEMVRRMGQVMLERLGYTVITANDGAEAVELFRQYKDRIACVLLDLTMPRLNGWEALQSIREIRADVPVILASGYDEAQVMQQDHAERPQAFLQKPFQMAALKAALVMTGNAPP